MAEENNPLLANAGVGNIFQTATGTYTPNNSWYTDPNWGNVAPPAGATSPFGGSIYGSTGGYSWDPEGWNADMTGGVYYTPGGFQVGGAGISTLPTVNTSTSTISSWGSTLGAGLLAGGLPGMVGAVGGRLLGGALGLGSNNTSTATGTGVVTMDTVKVPAKKYDEYGNEIVPFDIPNPLYQGIQMGPNVPSGDVVPMEPYNVADSKIKAQDQARRILEQQQALARLDAYIGRQSDTSIYQMPPYTVSEPPYVNPINRIPPPPNTPIAPYDIKGPGDTVDDPPPVNPPPVNPPPVNPPPVNVNPPPVNTDTPPGSGTNTGTYTAPTVNAPTGRNFYTEGRQTLTDLERLLPGITSLYGNTAKDLQASDLARLQGAATGIGGINQDLTGMAAAQTAAANSALRAGNIADAQKYASQALELRKQANPELYAGLSQYQNAAQNQVNQDIARFQQAQAGQLSPEEIRNAQQAAREAYAARGLVMGKGAIGAEILNRDALVRQRQQEARNNLASSMGQLYQGIGAQTANVFDPMAAVLGSQYGMQTSNVGMNQNLFNQSAGLASGAYGNQYAQGLANPFNPYAQDVYNTNFNAAAAKDIAAMNNAAAIEASKQSASATTGAANTALWTNLIGSGAKGFFGGLFGGG